MHSFGLTVHVLVPPAVEGRRGWSGGEHSFGAVDPQKLAYMRKASRKNRACCSVAVTCCARCPLRGYRAPALVVEQPASMLQILVRVPSGHSSSGGVPGGAEEEDMRPPTTDGAPLPPTASVAGRTATGRGCGGRGGLKWSGCNVHIRLWPLSHLGAGGGGHGKGPPPRYLACTCPHVPSGHQDTLKHMDRKWSSSRLVVMRRFLLQVFSHCIIFLHILGKDRDVPQAQLATVAVWWFTQVVV